MAVIAKKVFDPGKLQASRWDMSKHLGKYASNLR
jgi:hypothetical protein